MIKLGKPFWTLQNKDIQRIQEFIKCYENHNNYSACNREIYNFKLQTETLPGPLQTSTMESFA